MGEEGEGSGAKGGGNLEWGTPLSTPSRVVIIIFHVTSYENSYLEVWMDNDSNCAHISTLSSGLLLKNLF